VKTVCVGLDVGSTGCEIAVKDKETGKILERRAFATSEKNLLDAFKLRGREVHVHLEASEMAGWVRHVLKPVVARVVISHPKSNSWIGRDPLKNDRIDAEKLAELLRTGVPHEVYYPDEDRRAQFKRLVQHHYWLTRQVAGLKRSIKRHLRFEGVIVKNLGLYSRKGRKAVVERLASPVSRAALGQLYAVLDAAVQNRRSAEQLMRQEAKHFPEITLFEEVPGIGFILASWFSAYIQNPHRFANKRKLWRYCRLGVAWRMSDGKPLGRQSLDRNGCGILKDLSRKAFDANLKRKEESAFRRTFNAAWDRTGDKVHARLTVQRKIVATLWSMWRKNERYQEGCKG
jgi:transposase